MSLPASLSDSHDTDPYPIYEALRRQGDVVRDEGVAVWLVLDHAGCNFVDRRVGDVGVGDTPQEAARAALQALGEPYASEMAARVEGEG